MAPGFPRSADVRPHPHIRLSTVTYLFDGPEVVNALAQRTLAGS